MKAGYETFWSYIPHFIHSPFYVYAYAFGDCLVNSLYAVYEKSASGFAERYLEMLAAGGTKHHTELLAPFGLNARDPKFWDGGLSVIAGLIDELEALESALVVAAALAPGAGRELIVEALHLDITRRARRHARSDRYCGRDPYLRRARRSSCACATVASTIRG